VADVEGKKKFSELVVRYVGHEDEIYGFKDT
jgi:hypothetical protein